MTDAVEAQESLEEFLKDEIIRMYQDVADHPEGEFHFFHGRQAAELFGYQSDWLDQAPSGAVASFAGVGTRTSAATSSPVRRFSTWGAEPGSTRSSLRGVRGLRGK